MYKKVSTDLDFVKREKEVLSFWQENDIFKKAQAATFEEIDNMGRKTFTGKLELSAQEGTRLKELAKRGIAATAALSDLKKKLEAARNDARIWKERYEKLFEQTKVFIAAMKKAPEKMKAFIAQILRSEPDKTVPKKEIESQITK